MSHRTMSAHKQATRPAVFLDRDGTLIDETGYRKDPEGLRLYPGVGPALRRLKEAGFALVLVTNQSGIARGLLDETDLQKVHAALGRALAEHGVLLDAIEYCPHHPDQGQAPYRVECTCRKPLPGMIETAAAALELDPGRSVLIGDAARDLEAGRAAGVGELILVATGKGQSAHEDLQARGIEHVFVPDLAAAVEHVLATVGPAS